MHSPNITTKVSKYHAFRVEQYVSNQWTISYHCVNNMEPTSEQWLLTQRPNIMRDCLTKWLHIRDEQCVSNKWIMCNQ